MQQSHGFTRIAYNNFVSWYRKEQKIRFSNFDETVPPFPQSNYKEPEAHLLEKSQLHELKEHLAQLKGNEKKVIQLREFEDLSYQEIAEMTGWSISKVKTTLHRARKKLGERIGMVK